jgi:hypothetical protein
MLMVTNGLWLMVWCWHVLRRGDRESAVAVNTKLCTTVLGKTALSRLSET